MNVKYKGINLYEVYSTPNDDKHTLSIGGYDDHSCIRNKKADDEVVYSEKSTIEHKVLYTSRGGHTKCVLCLCQAEFGGCL